MHKSLEHSLRLTRRRAALQAFAVHLLIFASCLGLAFALNLDWTYFWPLVGWAIGLVLHGILSFGAGWIKVRDRELEHFHHMTHGGDPAQPPAGGSSVRLTTR